MLSTFQKNFINKKVFDPNDRKDVEIFKIFLEQNRWPSEGCPFILERPFISVPHMIQDKMVRKFLKIS